MRLFYFFAFLLLLISCDKPEGEGGRSAITGKIFVKDYDKEGRLKDEYYPGEWPVYIIYGDNTIYDDSVDTHSDGTFLFEYLYPGQYTIFAYSKCLLCPGGREIISVDVILEDRQIAQLEEIVIRD